MKGLQPFLTLCRLYFDGVYPRFWIAARLIPGAAPEFRERLGEDRGLSRQQALRAITRNSSYELHQDANTGSLEPGKLADLIVLDRNVIEIPPDQIADTRVLQTVVGGRVVYSAANTDRLL